MPRVQHPFVYSTGDNLLFLGFNNYDFCVNSILFDGLDAVLAASHSLIALAGGDDLAIGCLQAEAEFASLILVNLEFRMLSYLVTLNGLILDSSLGSVGHNTSNTLAAIFFCLVNLGGSDNLAIASLQIEFNTGLVWRISNLPIFLPPLEIH